MWKNMVQADGLQVTMWRIHISCLLTYSIVQSPSWEANWFAASQEIPRISRNPKVHYRTQKRPPNVAILGQPNPVHIPTFHLLEIHPNIIHPSTPRSPQWSPSLRFPQQDPIHPPLLTHTRHMPSPYHSSCWLSKTSNTHSEYVTLFAFPLQQWFYERVSLWRYSQTACLSHPLIKLMNYAYNLVLPMQSFFFPSRYYSRTLIMDTAYDLS